MSDVSDSVSPIVVVQSTPPKGRTGYDFLIESKKFIFLMLIVIVLAVYIFFKGFPDLSGIVDAIQEWWPLSIAFFAGMLTFSWIYWKFIAKGVVLLKESSPMACFFVTHEKFKKIVGSEKIVNPDYTKEGIPLYRVRSMELSENKVEFGRQHLVGMSYGEVLTFQENYDEMLEEYHKSETERNKLKDRVSILAMREGRLSMEALLKAIVRISKGEDPFEKGDHLYDEPEDVKK